QLFDRGRAPVRLDGEDMRLGISQGLGFSAEERWGHARRTAELARLVHAQGRRSGAALVAPKHSVRQRARELSGPERVVEVYLDAQVDVCRERDRSGLYAAADRGEIPMFPGVSATYDPPHDADLVLDTVANDIGACVEAIIAFLGER